MTRRGFVGDLEDLRHRGADAARAARLRRRGHRPAHGRHGRLRVLRAVVANRPDVPVVMITAFGSMESAVAAIRVGAYDFITKPFDVEILRLTLTRAVQHRRAPRRGEAPPPRGRRGPWLRPDDRLEPAHPEGEGADRSRLGCGTPRCSFTGESGTGRSSSRARCTSAAGARPAPSSPSTARRSLRPCSRASCSDTSRARSPTRAHRARDSSSRPTADPVPRRDRRDAAQHAAEAPPRAAGGRWCAGRRRPGDPVRGAHHHGLESRSRAGVEERRFARISSTGSTS